MALLLADSFQSSLDKLNGEEQKAAKLAAFELQINPANPGLQCHRLENIKDKNFWSARVNRDLRLIFHRVASSLMLVYVDHHDAAYDWAARRKIETHPVTGAAQIVEIRETVREIEIPVYVPKEQPRSPEARQPLAQRTEAELLSYGVPAEWIPDVRAATEDTLLTIATHLPAEAAEAVLDLATGTTPTKPLVTEPDQTDPFAHPDAQRRFRILTGAEELARALDYPWERWIVFLHPSQQDWVGRSFNGPTRVQGSAGTGKTVVALHRAVFLARRNPDARVLLTTFSKPLAALLQEKLHRLVQGEPSLLERLDVLAMEELGERIHTAQLGAPQRITPGDLDALIRLHAPPEITRTYGEAFVVEEFREIVDAFHLRDWDSYRDVRRLGRRSRLNEAKRRLLWQGFEQVLQELNQQGLITDHQLFHRSADQLHRTVSRPYQHIVVDECQDITAGRPIVCLMWNPMMWMAMCRTVAAPSPSSAAQIQRSRPATTRTAKLKPSPLGSRSTAAKASLPTTSESSYVARPRSPVPRQPWSLLASPSSASAPPPCASAARPPSPPCTWPKGSNSVP